MIETHALCKQYYGGTAVKALVNVELNVTRGEFVAIMGQSGSGKTTLMSILGCLDRPTSGFYKLMGADTAALARFELAKLRNNAIGFVFQAFHLINSLTARENIELPMLYAGLGKEERRQRANELLSYLGLRNRALHYPGELSGGQKQRVAIARALANNPPLILADEPTGNLDSKSSADIMALLRGLNQRGATIVLITHEDEIARYAGRVCRMRDGALSGGVC